MNFWLIETDSERAFQERRPMAGSSILTLRWMVQPVILMDLLFSTAREVLVGTSIVTSILTKDRNSSEPWMHSAKPISSIRSESDARENRRDAETV
jgi:hypothetical protein